MNRELVYVAGTRGIDAIDATTGSVRWRFASEHPVRGAPVAAGNVVYALVDYGGVYALDAATGVVRWQQQVAYLATPVRPRSPLA